jgi:hypothetical protein
MRSRLLFALFACVLGAFAADDPFVGAWKLNAAKSKFSPGPAPQSITVTIAQDSVTVEETSAQGETAKWSYPTNQSGPATVTGMPNSTVVETRKGNTVEHSWKFGNSAMTGKGVVSKDGKTMTYSLRGTDEKGQKVSNTEVYEKQ